MRLTPEGVTAIQHSGHTIGIYRRLQWTERSSLLNQADWPGQTGKTADYPAKPVRVIEPFGVGGGPDLVARSVSRKLSELWGRPVTVENFPGAGSTAAPAFVAKSLPDGYTLLINTSAQSYGPALLKDLPYDALKDFIPVAPLTSQPYVLVAGTSSGIQTVCELVAAARAKPGNLRFASAGIGTATHFGVEKLNLEAGIKAVHVPARPEESIADVVASVAAGRATYMIAPIPLVMSGIGAGRLRALGVTTKRRSNLLPGVPALAEAGIAGFDFPIWYGIWAPAATPAPVVQKVAKDIARALSTPDVRASLAKDGGDPVNMTQPEFARFVLSEAKKAESLVQAAGIKPPPQLLEQ